MMLMVINIFCHMVITIVNEVIHENLLYYMENNKHNKYYLYDDYNVSYSQAIGIQWGNIFH